jgi:hypothetical protein
MFPLLALMLLCTVTMGCGAGSPQDDPNIKVEKGKTFEESLPKKNLTKGKKALHPQSPSERMGTGPD